jgi:hypothetical protein
MLDGVKVGTADVSKSGVMSMIITSEKVVEMLAPKADIQHLSIDPTYKL